MRSNFLLAAVLIKRRLKCGRIRILWRGLPGWLPHFVLELPDGWSIHYCGRAKGHSSLLDHVWFHGRLKVDWFGARKEA